MKENSHLHFILHHHLWRNSSTLSRRKTTKKKLLQQLIVALFLPTFLHLSSLKAVPHHTDKEDGGKHELENNNWNIYNPKTSQRRWMKSEFPQDIFLLQSTVSSSSTEKHLERLVECRNSQALESVIDGTWKFIVCRLWSIVFYTAKAMEWGSFFVICSWIMNFSHHRRPTDRESRSCSTLYLSRASQIFFVYSSAKCSNLCAMAETEDF